MSTDTSEKGLELLIVRALTGLTDAQILSAPGGGVAEAPVGYGGAGYVLGRSEDYDRDYAVDLPKLLSFIQATQPAAFASLGLATAGPQRLKFLSRVQGEVTKRGIVDVLRKGVAHGPARVELFYGAPSPGNTQAGELWEANIFSVTRQLRYSKSQPGLALDLALLINGLPVATFELKNRLTRQTVDDAVWQYKRDRDPHEPLFQFARCLVHFAVDDQQVMFCTRLAGQDSWFLPFNRGWNGGAGNPPNPHGLKTAYLWDEALSRQSLTDILENYAQRVETRDPRTGHKRAALIFPRYHQLDVVRQLIAHAHAQGAGQRYLIQHSAGSGKSNSIAWLAHQLVGLQRGAAAVFDSVIVVTDRVLLDRQISETIRQFAQVGSIIGHAEGSGQLKGFLQGGKKIVITTVQKFPFVLDDIGDQHRDRRFAILIDEAHSSQGGRTAATMNMALAQAGAEDDGEDPEDRINRIMEARKMLSNASYFAFTATPKNKTLEIFGQPVYAGDVVGRRPFHSYTMKQAIEERFILDVLAAYTTYQGYYNLIKTAEDDPEFDVARAQRKLKGYVEGHDQAIAQKARIMADHFHDQVIKKQKIGGQARAMVVTGSVAAAIAYYQAFRDYLEQRNSPYRAIVAFSGERQVGGVTVSEATLNGFPSGQIAERIQHDPYRFLICADKFQTGYDEPLLHTMYVDKPLAGIKAVQTLSRLNRAHPHKHDTFVLDFFNDADTIEKAFQPYYQTTTLSGETDPNRLHDLKADLDAQQVYDDAAVHRLVELYLGGAARDALEPILEGCVAAYTTALDAEGQIIFKGNAKAFTRAYSFLAAVLPYSNAAWEQLSIFLNFLVPKLPAPEETDFSRGVLEAVDMDSYRVEARATMNIALADQDGEISPISTTAGTEGPEAELDHLSAILRAFNDRFGAVEWKDGDKIRQVIAQELPAKVAADTAYQNAMKNSDEQNARIEHDSALQRAILDGLSDHTELFKQFSDNPQFKRWLGDAIFKATYHATTS